MRLHGYELDTLVSDLIYPSLSTSLIVLLKEQ